jgi:hypothetical protein
MEEAFAVNPLSSLQPVDVSGRADAARAEAPVQPVSPVGNTDPSAQEGVQVEISDQGRDMAQKQKDVGQKPNKAADQSQTDHQTQDQKNVDGLSPEDERKVSEMVSTDHKVHTHEQAHMAAGGSLVRGGPSYNYRTGPDGKRYVVSGEVNIDTSTVRDDPDATIRKGYRIRAAALAPADPSSQDRKVASDADAMIMRAQMEKLTSKNSEMNSSDGQSSGNSKVAITGKLSSLPRSGIAAD